MKAVIKGVLKGIGTMLLFVGLVFAMISPFLGVYGAIYSLIVMVIIFGYMGYIEEKTKDQ